MFDRSLNKVVVFSPGKSLKAARGVARRLRKYAQVQVWQEAFRKYQAKELFKALHNILSEVDYAVFVLASDGRAPEDRLASQNNLMFELGQAMEKLGQENVFIICDSKASLPAYLQSVVLAFYDGSDPATLSEACKAIVDKIAAGRFSYLSGEWKSEYPVPFIENHPVEIELVKVVGQGTRIKIVSVANSKNDYYGATAWLDNSNGHFFGRWKSIDLQRRGWLVLYLSPCGKLMYGWYTGKNRHGREIQGYWVLAKNDADEAEVFRRLDEGRARLPRIIKWPRARRALLSLKAKAKKFNKFLGLF